MVILRIGFLALCVKRIYMYREAVNLVYDSGCKNSKILYGSCKKVTGMDFF